MSAVDPAGPAGARARGRPARVPPATVPGNLSRTRDVQPASGVSVRAEEEEVTAKPAAHSRALRLIAIFKLIKGAALVVAGLGIVHFIHRDAAFTLEDWVM